MNECALVKYRMNENDVENYVLLYTSIQPMKNVIKTA